MCGEWQNVKENLAYNKIVNCVLLSYNIVKCLFKTRRRWENEFNKCSVHWRFWMNKIIQND